VTKTGTMKARVLRRRGLSPGLRTRHPTQPYIAINDLPKVDNLKTAFPALWRETPVLVAQAAKGN